jgi:hypothetical protein
MGPYKISPPALGKDAFFGAMVRAGALLFRELLLWTVVMPSPRLGAARAIAVIAP